MAESVTSWGLPPTKTAVAEATVRFIAKLIRSQKSDSQATYSLRPKAKDKPVTKPTMRDKFLAANKESPVVSGFVNMKDGKPCGGVSYKLKNGKRFRLGVADSIDLPPPVWDLPPAPKVKAPKTKSPATKPVKASG